MTVLQPGIQGPVLVVGMPGAGKSTIAKALAKALTLTYIDVDALKHGAGWSVRPELVADVERLTSGSAWVADSAAYPQVADLLWNRAGVVIVLDLPRRVLLARLVHRTVRRQLTRQELSHGNRESIGRVFSSRHPIAKVLTSYTSRRNELIRRAKACPGRLIHITSVGEAHALISALNS
jgi:adenylate kinase family enzyme